MTDNLKQYQHYINGAWHDPATGEWFESDDPYRASPWALIARGNAEDADRAVTAARQAFIRGEWPALSASARGAALRRIGDLLDARAEELAKTESRDNGKRMVEVIPQLCYLSRGFHYYGGLADKIEGAVIPLDVPKIFNYTCHEPLGVVAAITPWNSPLMLAAWKMAPALAAGNTVVIKPSEHASASTLEFAALLEEAELPPGVINVVTGYGPEIGEPLVTHPDVAKITFTGSVAGGKRVSKLAADGVKRVTLELGGKSPQLVFADASLNDAINGVISGIFLSNGQTCVAGSRLLLHEPIHNEFLEKLIGKVERLRMGDPADSDTDIGPIANRPQFERILDHIEDAKKHGATCIQGGQAATRSECGDGWFVEPTVFTKVTPDMRIAREEVFGPVLAVMSFRDEEEAIAIANDTVYGLAAGVWTQDLRRAHVLSSRLQAGTVYVNTYRSVSVMSPVGGYKQSGYGRENGMDMIRDYMQVKSVWLNTDRVPDPFAART